MSQTSVHVQQLDATYLVARGRADANLVQRRLDHIARELLSRSLERSFHGLDRGDGALYFIESMNVDCLLDLLRDDEALAREWAGALHRNVLLTINGGGSGVKVFRDRGQYLSSFLDELLRGTAWLRWYYGEFEGLRSLKVGEAAIHALTEDGDAGRDALLELTRRGALDLLLSALDDGEVERVVHRCLLPPGPALTLTHMYRAWAAALRPLLQRFARGESRPRSIAKLYLALLCERPDLGPDVNLARFIRDLLDLREALTAKEGGRAFAAMIQGGNWTRVASLMSDEGVRRLLLNLTRELDEREATELLRDLQGAEVETVERVVMSEYGGLFLLAPEVAELGLHDFLAGCAYPEPPFAQRGGLMLFLMALQCIGAIAGTRTDAGLLLFAGLSSSPTRANLRDYAASLTTGMHEAFRLELSLLRGVNAGAQASAPASAPVDRDARMDARGQEYVSLSSGEEALLPSRELDEALAAVSRAVMKQFASKLGALSLSSRGYLSRNFFESRAEISVSVDSIRVRFLTCPLQMVLRMAGFDHDSWKLPWLGGRKLEFIFEE